MGNIHARLLGLAKARNEQHKCWGPVQKAAFTFGHSQTRVLAFLSVVWAATFSVQFFPVAQTDIADKQDIIGYYTCVACCCNEVR